MDIEQAVKQAMISSGIPYEDITITMDLARHARNQVTRMMIRITESAPPHLQMQVMLVILALMVPHMEELTTAATEFLKTRENKL